MIHLVSLLIGVGLGAGGVSTYVLWYLRRKR